LKIQFFKKIFIFRIVITFIRNAFFTMMLLILVIVLIGAETTSSLLEKYKTRLAQNITKEEAKYKAAYTKAFSAAVVIPEFSDF